MEASSGEHELIKRVFLLIECAFSCLSACVFWHSSACNVRCVAAVYVCINIRKKNENEQRGRERMHAQHVSATLEL